MLKAIETEYGGIRYRSKLEACWARFITEHDIRHKYEFAKVDLGIDKYTPDFWLPDFKIWIEVKPFRQSRAHSKCYRLAIETRCPVLLVQGDPFQHVVDLFDPNARRQFVHRIVVSEAEIKPSKQFLRFENPALNENVLVLVNDKNERIRFENRTGGLR